MTFRFTSTNPHAQAQTSRAVQIELCLEGTFDDGRVIQSTTVQTASGRTLVYREAATGRWLSAAGISFEGLPRTPENLIRTLGKRDPLRLVYVMPAA